MKISEVPFLFPVPFANQADASTIIPGRSLPMSKPAYGQASMLSGFPAETFTPLNAGGKPVQGKDLQTILYMLSVAARAAEMGVLRKFSSDYASSAGGYPAQAMVAHPSAPGRFLICTQDGNTNDPAQNMAGWSDPLAGQLTSNDLARYLPLSGGTLTGQTTLSDQTGNDSAFVLDPAKGHNGYVKITPPGSVQMIGYLGGDGRRLQFVTASSDFSNFLGWALDGPSGAMIAPNGHTYLEMAGSGPYKIQTFTASARHGQWISFPEQFSGDDVKVVFSNNYNGGQFNNFAINTDSSTPKNRSGFTVAAYVIIPGSNTQPFILNNAVNIDIIAVGRA